MITTHHEYRDYVFSIEYRPQEPVYTVEFADLPEIISSGDTLAVAFANAGAYRACPTCSWIGSAGDHVDFRRIYRLTSGHGKPNMAHWSGGQA